MARRVIVLGFDGLDPRLCRRFMGAGLLPNFSRLAAQGAFRELNTSIPCQSPVAWRTLMTGVNPGVHGVYDFLKRKSGTYLPELATAARVDDPLLPETWHRIALGLGAGAIGAAGAYAALSAMGRVRDKPVSRRGFLAACVGVPLAAATAIALTEWIPKNVPRAENRCGGEPFWSRLGRAGARTTALRAPVEFPARTYPNSRVLSGLGVPDVRATNGTPVIRTLYESTVYAGQRTEDAADFVVGFHPGYRVSWQTALGGVPSELIEPNERVWNSDHCSLDPAVTPGVLFGNRPFRDAPADVGDARRSGGGTWPSVMDIAPTVCRALGIDPSPAMEGEALV